MVLSVELLAKIDKFSKNLTKGQKALTGFSGFVVKAFSVVAITGFGKEILTVSGDFEHAMARVKAISGATETEFKALNDVAKELGETTPYSATQVGEALTYLSMAGLEATESISALPNVLQLATAGAISLAEASDITTNVLTGFGLEVSQLGMVNDILAKTATSSNTSILELGEAFKVSAPVARGLGIDITDVATALGLMANGGIKGAEAGTAVAGALARLLRQPKMVADEISNLGLIISESTIKSDGFIGTIRKLTEAGATNTQMTKIFGKQWKMLGPIINATDKQINKMEGTVKNYDGTAKKVAEEGMGQWRKATLSLSSATEGLMIKMGEGGMLSIGTKVANVLTEIVRNAKPIAQVFGSAGAGIIAYKLATGGATMTTGLFSSALKVAKVAVIGLNTAIKSNPIGLMVGVAIALVGALISIKSALDDTENSFDSIASSIDTSTRRMGNLFSILESTTTSTEGKKYAMNQINDLYGEYLPNLLKESDGLDTIRNAYNLASTALKEHMIQKRRATEESKIFEDSIEKENKVLEDFFGSIGSEEAKDRVQASFRGLVAEYQKLNEEGKHTEALEMLSAWEKQMGINQAVGHTYISRLIKINKEEAASIDLVRTKYERLGKQVGASSLALMNMPKIEFGVDTTEGDIDELFNNLEISDVPVGIKPIAYVDQTQEELDAELDGLYLNLEIDDAPIGVIEKLRAELALLTIARDKANSTGEIEKYNAKIVEGREKLKGYTETQTKTNTEADKYTKELGTVGGVMGNLGSLSEDFHSDSISDWMNLVSVIANSVAQIIPLLLASATAKAVDAGAKVPFPGNLPAIALGIGAVSSAFSGISAFADGGIVSGETLALVGEYRGASNNPEVIAPLNKLKSMIADTTGNGGGIGGDVEFILRGENLYGSIKNHERKKNNRR